MAILLWTAVLACAAACSVAVAQVVHQDQTHPNSLASGLALDDGAIQQLKQFATVMKLADDFGLVQTPANINDQIDAWTPERKALVQATIKSIISTPPPTDCGEPLGPHETTAMLSFDEIVNPIPDGVQDLIDAGVVIGMMGIIVHGMQDWMACRNYYNVKASNDVITQSKAAFGLLSNSDPKPQPKPRVERPQPARTILCTRPSKPLLDDALTADLKHYIMERLGMDPMVKDKSKPKPKNAEQLLAEVRAKATAMATNLSAQVATLLREAKTQVTSSIVAQKVDPDEYCSKMLESYSPGWVMMDSFVSVAQDPSQSFDEIIKKQAVTDALSPKRAVVPKQADVVVQTTGSVE